MVVLQRIHLMLQKATMYLSCMLMQIMLKQLLKQLKLLWRLEKNSIKMLSLIWLVIVDMGTMRWMNHPLPIRYHTIIFENMTLLIYFMFINYFNIIIYLYFIYIKNLLYINKNTYTLLIKYILQNIIKE